MRDIVRSLLGGGGESDTPSLSPKELLILRTLIAGAKYGQELVDGSDGELKRGTIYVTLARMADKGYVDSTQEDRPAHEGGLPRRRYRITGEGERVLRVVERIEALLAGGRLA